MPEPTITITITQADFEFAVYAAAYASLRDYKNHPQGDRGLIVAGVQKVPEEISKNAWKMASRRA
jgi:hypothetical protein